MTTEQTMTCDVAVIGAGIVGLATTLALKEQYPNAKIIVIEKETGVAKHQTGNNSGVVHAGIYYKPGSHKARLCLEGVRLLKDFCETHGLSYDRCGKVIVATKETELPLLEALFERGLANGVPGIRMVDRAELTTIEPHAAGIKAIHSPNTAIVNYRQISEKIAALLEEQEVTIVTGATAEAIEATPRGVRITAGETTVEAGFLVNCAGLYSDHVARLSGATPKAQIIPFRGEYYFLRKESRHLVRGLIYPVPDPSFPFLGVHLTRTVSGEVEAGPNAVFAFAREGYSYAAVNPSEMLSALTYKGFLRLAAKHWKVGIFEYYRSLSKQAFVASLQRLVPDIKPSDVTRGHAGVRAQAIDKSGNLVDDFVFEETENALHVLNAPSPAATASLAIGRHIASLVKARTFAQ